MPSRTVLTTLAAALLASCEFAVIAEEPIPAGMKAFFKAEVDRIAAHPLGDAQSAEDWKAKRPEAQRRMREMLGLDPMPPRTDLKAEIRGTVEAPDFVVERLVFQSSPGLYVTANLFRPKVVEKPLPAIVYVCGHGKEEKDGVIFGNKTHYQHHAAWYAANGYVCLVLDTLQLGEVPGLHHGTHHLNMWWWQSRGYTPAGVEVWNGIRAIDYLCSRPEVDADRIGVTGRSGGGAMSWYLGAVDDRLKVVVAVAGITDLQDHVVAGNPKVAYPEGVVDGHCDCMYFVNTYRWDYTMLAALVAPKALLVENNDVDPIFPEVGVRRIYGTLEKVYDWYGTRERLDIVIGKGGHADTPELRHPEFAWFERWFKGRSAQSLDKIQEPDRKLPLASLKVLDPKAPLPANANDTIHESFIPRSGEPPIPETDADWKAIKARWRSQAAEQVFARTSAPFGTTVTFPFAALNEARKGILKDDITLAGVGVSAFDVWLTDRPDLRSRVWVFHKPGGRPHDGDLELLVMGSKEWSKYEGLIEIFEAEKGDPSSHPRFAELKRRIDAGESIGLLAPIGVGRTAWPKSKDLTIRRRLALLGLTLDGLRVDDVQNAVIFLTGWHNSPLRLKASGEMAPIALWAAILDNDEGKPQGSKVRRLLLENPPATVQDGPAFLNLDRILDMPQAVALMYPVDVCIEGSPEAYWAWPRDLSERLGSKKPWPEIIPTSTERP
ncbi:alpha/beta hydrolase family protein [Paludisphaera rhizosphaerae]|uniref:alpha/beta hydrolase family protein n=1 Tax=Paludisphaera rhizosphaerae TaxID=2711216 RepID=UPI0013EB3408|nr:acetylxylan esterase [Paludisphaera rhizosphaerae]